MAVRDTPEEARLTADIETAKVRRDAARETFAAAEDRLVLLHQRGITAGREERAARRDRDTKKHVFEQRSAEVSALRVKLDSLRRQDVFQEER